jgi:uncharacterized membrane-anchored protein YjiN (DUF445 family)
VVQSPPYKKRQIIAVVLLIFFFIGNIWIFFTGEEFKNNYKYFYYFFKHGFEGGLIGGLCDWFAVWKTYNAIENDSNSVAEEIGKWVSKDLLNHQTLRDQFNQILESPENQKQIIQLLETYFDTKENTKKVLDGLWLKIETPVIDYIVHYNFSNKDFSLINATTQDQIILHTIKICVGDTLYQISQEQSFRDTLNHLLRDQNILTKIITNLINIPEILKNYGEKLKYGKMTLTNEEKYLDELITLISLSADKYIMAWSKLSYDEKYQAVHSLIFKIKEAIGGILAGFIIEYKEDLKARRSLSEYKPVKEVFNFIEEKIDYNVSEFIGQKISERLKSQDPKDFRKRIEWQTRNVLENIRINGTLLGFALGGFLGLIQGFIG